MHARQVRLIQHTREISARLVPHTEQLADDVPKHLAQLTKIQHDLREAGRLLQEAHAALNAIEVSSPVALDPVLGPAFTAAEKKLATVWSGFLFEPSLEHLRDLLKAKGK